jgi:hypothetical protein
LLLVAFVAKLWLGRDQRQEAAVPSSTRPAARAAN